jgi:hypothetical protein
MFRQFALKYLWQGTNKKNAMIPGNVTLKMENWFTKQLQQVLGRQTTIQTVASWIKSKFHSFPAKIVSSYNIETWVIIWERVVVMCVVVCVVWAVTVASLSLLIAAYHFLIMPESPIFCILSSLLFWYIIMGMINCLPCVYEVKCVCCWS